MLNLTGARGSADQIVNSRPVTKKFRRRRCQFS